MNAELETEVTVIKKEQNKLDLEKNKREKEVRRGRSSLQAKDKLVVDGKA